MDAPRFASLEGANANPAGRGEHSGDFPFTPSAPWVGATAFRVAKAPGRVVEASKRILQTHRVSREIPFQGKHRSLRDGNVGSHLLCVDRGFRDTFPLACYSCASSMRARAKPCGVRRSRTTCS
jgi:hypothetical protein